MLLDEQRGKPLNMNFVGLYWQQVSGSGRRRRVGLIADAGSGTGGASGECGTYRSETGQLRAGQGTPEDHRFRDR